MRVTLIHNPNAGENDDAGEALRSLVAVARASWRISRTSPRFELALPELPRRRGKLILLGPPVESRLHVDERLWPDDPDERGDGTARVTSAASRAAGIAATSWERSSARTGWWLRTKAGPCASASPR